MDLLIVYQVLKVFVKTVTILEVKHAEALQLIIVLFVTLLALHVQGHIVINALLVIKMQLFNQIKHAFATKAFHEILFVLETSLVPLCL
jgi:hypothetical protein